MFIYICLDSEIAIKSKNNKFFKNTPEISYFFVILNLFEIKLTK